MPTCADLGKHENLEMLVGQRGIRGKHNSLEQCTWLRSEENPEISSHLHEHVLIGVPDISVGVVDRVRMPPFRRGSSTRLSGVIHDLHRWHFLRSKQAEVEISSENRLRRTFRTLAEHWRRDTRFVSLARKKIMHPAYQRIIGLGPQALPLIFKELKQRPSQWFWALECITGEDPARDSSTFADAVEQWLAWARRNGYLDE